MPRSIALPAALFCLTFLGAIGAGGSAAAAEPSADPAPADEAAPAESEGDEPAADTDREPNERERRADVEVMVTATFRDTVARDVPASVVVLGGEDVRDTTSMHFEDVSQLVPDLTFSGEGNRARYWQIRGVGERESYTGAPNPSVGFVVDDVDLSGIGGVATLWDVDQIDVLRGPQGTRFGASALAGAVYMRTAPPPDRFELNSEVTLGSDDLQSIGLTTGGPLSGDGSVAYRFSVQRLEGDGFRDNVYLPADDTNGRKETTLRGKLRWRVSDAWNADLTVFRVDLDDGYDAFTIDNDLTTESDRPGRDAQRTLAGSVRLTGRASRAFHVVSITSLADTDGEFSFDADWGNAELWAPYTYDFFSRTLRRRRSLTQEVRLISTPEGRFGGGRVGWVAGVYASRLHETNDTTDDGIYVDSAFPDDPYVLDAAIRRTYNADNVALFSEVSADLSARTTLAVGMRGERRQADYGDDAGSEFHPAETMVGGQVTLSRKIGTESNLYGRIARGYKAGGFNVDLPADATDDQRIYDAEYLWNYEAGLKGRRGDGRAAWDLVAFWSERRDQQVETSVQLDPNNPTTFVFYTDNAGSGTNAGVEASGTWRALPRLSLRASVGWLETEIDEFGSFENLRGRDQAYAPRFSYAAGGTWRGGDGRFARVDVVGKTSYYFDTSHDQRSDPYTLVHARVGIERDGWSAFLWGRNLFDEVYATRGFYFGNEPPDFPDRLYVKRGDPRQLGIALRFAL